MQDWWLQAKKLEGPWEYAKKLPDDMKKAEEFTVSQNQRRILKANKPNSKPSLKETGQEGGDPGGVRCLRACRADRNQGRAKVQSRFPALAWSM